MNINPKSLGLAVVITAAVLWSIYRAGAFVLLVIEIYVSSHFGYIDLSNYDWKPEIADFVLYLLVISLGAGLMGWLIAGVYNFLNKIFAPRLP